MIGTVYLEELRATLRGRFAWLGAGVVLFAIGGLATVATQDTWIDGYAIVAYFLVPLTFVPLAAGMIASPRANRFVESLFTAPVERRTWLVAKVLVLFTLGAAYYLALVPMLLVYVANVGLPVLLAKLLVWAPLLLLVSISIGVLIGVLFVGRSIAAPAATGMGVMLVYAALVPLQELLTARGNGASRSGHVALASPAALLKNALGFALATTTVPASTARTWIAVAVITTVALATAAWVFLLAQGVESWEATPRKRWIIGLSLASLVLVPVFLADTDYDRPAPPTSNAPAIRGLFSRAGSSLGLTDPGGRLPDRCCSTILNRGEWPALSADRSTRKDLLVLLPVEASRTLTDVTVDVSGGNGLIAQVEGLPPHRFLEQLERRSYVDETGPPAADGTRIATGWVVRVPVTLTPRRPWDTGGLRYPLDVTASYRVEDDGNAHVLKARGAVEAQIASAGYEMGAAGIVLPALCFFASFRRWRRTR